MDQDERLKPLRKSLHDLNNGVGVILATAELLQLEQLSPKAMERSRVIEQKALEVREILRGIGEQYFE